MERDPVLGALTEHWHDVRRELGETRAGTLAEMMAGIRPGAPTVTRYRLRAALMTRLGEWLPSGHPVRRAIRQAGGVSRNAPSAVDLDWEQAFAEIRLALAGAETPSAAAAKRALLAEPSLTPDELRARGGDPERAGLLRLRAPDGSIVLPAFQFTGQGAPYDVVVAVNALLHADTDPWGVADWWLRGNAWLGDDVPAGFIGVVPDDDLITAARAVSGGE